MRPVPSREAGFTLAEVMVSAVVLGIFMASMFEVSAVCLRYVSSSKENISSIECVQDRIEQMRGMDFTNLLDETYMRAAPTPPPASPSPSPPQRRNLTTPSNASELARQATETITISTYSGTGPTTPRVTYIRPPGAKIVSTPFSDVNVVPAPGTWVGGTSFPSTTKTVQVDVTYSWNATFGGRARSETSSTIISAGTKK
ncbi:MAG TPA: prepilin-type N-terminal cleavage/methylation domain-containing protein [Verrucomicrobiae bacterium]|nr:prepilin-type N-terminal cleavage/methylation domain-containing protein [Verrucomicrobiae bacterium]